jgi:hypothetical protein
MRHKLVRTLVAVFIPAFAAHLLLLSAAGAACKSCKPHAAPASECKQRPACLRPTPPRGL